MKKHYSFLVVFLCSLITTKAQLPTGSYSDYFKEGNFLLLEENYDLALKNFLEAYRIDSSSANINYSVGLAYLHSSRRKGNAEYYLAKAVKDVAKNYRPDDASEKEAPPTAIFYYAKALHINYKFDDAIAQYNTYDNLYAKDKLTKKEVDRMRKQSEYAKTLAAAPINVQVRSLGDSINSEYADFAPAMSADERMLIYTTRRPMGNSIEKDVNGQYYEDIVVSYKDDNGIWSRPVPLSEYVNTPGHEASVNLTPDGQTLIVFKGVTETDGNIYYSTWDGKSWGSLEQFGSDINSKYWESHACLSADGNTLYFVSNRPGGQGGRDIYRCVKLPNNKWSLAQNLGPVINTPEDEDGVFIHPDGVTLIFSSNGHKSMGGFDIFFSMIDEDKKFSEPFNMGYPINTPDDDVFFVTSPDGKRAYFSSDKDGGLGEKDIYEMFIPEAKEKPLALFKGQIIPADGEKLPDELMVVVTDKETGALVGTYRLQQNGTFSTILPPNKDYTFSYQAGGQEFYTEDLYVSNDIAYQEIRKAINLEPVKLLGKVAVKPKAVMLNVVVLDNPKDKKAVANAKITLTEKGGAETTVNADANGRSEAIKLDFNKSYTVVAEANGQKSQARTFNTNNIKGSKTLSEVLYLNGKAAKSLPLAMNVTVQDKKNKPVAGAKVTLNGNDGSHYEGITDSKGRLKGVELSQDVNYEVMAEKDGMTSEKTLFTTMNVKAAKTYNKPLVLENAGETEGPSACGTPLNYEYHFAYNATEINESADPAWASFIDGIVTMTKNCAPVVKVLSSASTVPTKSFASNNELAKSRAEKFEEKVKQAVAAKGGDVSRIKFSKHWAVRGPAYSGDAEAGKEKYEAYQYVKVMVK